MMAASSEISVSTVPAPAGAARAASTESADDGGCGIRDLVGQGDEPVVLRDEVGLARELDQRDLAVLLPCGDEALARGTVGALGIALRALETKDLDGLLDVAVGLFERLLRVDHARAELVAQRLDVGDGEVCHGWRLLDCGEFRGMIGGVAQNDPAERALRRVCYSAASMSATASRPIPSASATTASAAVGDLVATASRRLLGGLVVAGDLGLDGLDASSRRRLRR